MKKFLAVVLVSLLAACGSGPSGTYSDDNGVMSITFKSGGKAFMSSMGFESEVNYKVDDGKVVVTGANGNLVLDVQSDGSLEFMGSKLTKKKS